MDQRSLGLCAFLLIGCGGGAASELDAEATENGSGDTDADGGDSGETGGDAGETSGGSEETGGDSEETGGESGETGGDTGGDTGSESGESGSDSGGAGICGDGVVDDGEECDDGNDDDTDDCVGECAWATCGDGFVHATDEACDDHNLVEDDGCDNECRTPGTLLWSLVTDGAVNGSDQGQAVTTASDGTAIVVADQWTDGGEVIWLLEDMDEDGPEGWTFEYETRSTAAAVAADPSDNLVVLGYSFLPDNAGHRTYLRKFAADGTPEWTREPEDLLVTELATDSTGSIYVSGLVTAPDLTLEGRLRRYDADGNTVWTVDHDDPDDQDVRPDAVAVDPSDEVIVAGSIVHPTEGWSIYLRKYDADGTELWTVSPPSANGSDIANCVATDASGNIVVGGWRDGGLFLAKYDPDGTEQWTLDAGGPHVADVAIDLDGNIVITGSDNHDAVVRKYDPDGATVWTSTWNGEDDLSDAGRGVAVDDEGYIWMTGWTRNDEGLDILTAVFTP